MTAENWLGDLLLLAALAITIWLTCTKPEVPND